MEKLLEKKENNQMCAIKKHPIAPFTTHNDV
jgi:hypothetical protein